MIKTKTENVFFTFSWRQISLGPLTLILNEEEEEEEAAAAAAMVIGLEECT